MSETGKKKTRSRPSEPEPTGTAAAIALAGASREKADTFLDEQTALTRLQMEHLHEQRELHLSHLRWERFEDRMNGALKILVVVLGVALVAILIVAAWTASQADGLVVDEFSTPAAYGQAGMNGDVLAEDFAARLAQVSRFAMDHSFSNSAEVKWERKNGVRVEIPETGISLAEAMRILRGWLGRERMVSGNLRDLGHGQIALTIDIADAPPVSVSGPAQSLDALEQDAAEQVFGELDPVNVVNYLSAKDRHAEALAAAGRYVPIAQTPAERADSYGLWSYTTADMTGDLDLAIARAQLGIRFDPALAVVHIKLADYYGDLGRSEDVLHEAQTVLTLHDDDQLPAHQGRGLASMRAVASALVARLLGDFQSGCASEHVHLCGEAEIDIYRGYNAARRHDPVEAAQAITEARAAGAVNEADDAEARYQAEAELGDWRGAEGEAAFGASAYARDHATLNPRLVSVTVQTRFAPLLAVAEARQGKFDAAEHVITVTPDDCYECARARGLIASLQDHELAAVYWFGHAVKLGRSLPFAYADWGTLLLEKGYYDAAIAKFDAASRKGPHFADPLELWGEALMLENRSDLALARFEEANRTAPNWGRLHLKWGEALFYSGSADAAKAQFALAGRLALSTTDRAALARWIAAHG
jgi:tetratricopeptide (TPR) repeat protein